MRLPIEVKETTLPGDAEEAYSFAKKMAKIEAKENLKREVKSGFWVSIVNILAQRLSAVQHGEPVFFEGEKNGKET